jgi:hypothetical protein
MSIELAGSLVLSAQGKVPLVLSTQMPVPLSLSSQIPNIPALFTQESSLFAHSSQLLVPVDLSILVLCLRACYSCQHGQQASLSLNI